MISFFFLKDSDGSALEAHDLENGFETETTTRSNFRDTENEVGDNEDERDYEVILKRLTKLEKVTNKNFYLILLKIN